MIVEISIRQKTAGNSCWRYAGTHSLICKTSDIAKYCAIIASGDWPTTISDINSATMAQEWDKGVCGASKIKQKNE